MGEKKWSKICPDCGKEIYYSRQSGLTTSLLHNTKCKVCLKEYLKNKFKKKCPGCNKEMYLWNPNKLRESIETNEKCRKCKEEKYIHKEYIRGCPECGNLIKYSHNASLKQAISKNSKCYKCHCKNKDRVLKCVLCGKMRQLNSSNFYKSRSRNRVCLECARKKRKTGEYRFCKCCDKELFSGIREDKEFCSHNCVSLFKAGKPLLKRRRRKNVRCYECQKIFETINSRNSKFCCEKCRIKYFHFNGIWRPKFNPVGCEYFSELETELGWNGYYATKNYEYLIETNSKIYFLDYYEPTLNIAIEFDEKHHFTPDQIKKDLKRQNNIINHLKCEFYRVNENTLEIIKVS